MRIVPRAGCGDDLGDLVWLTDQRHHIMGTDFRVLTQDEHLAHRVNDLLGPFESTTRAARVANTIKMVTSPDGTHRLYRDCYRVTSQEQSTDLLPALVGTINRTAVERSENFAVHAGVVGLDDSVVAFPATSGGGKTTLTASCLLAGFAYLSDEALMLGDGGDVIPYPKPLALSVWSSQALGIEVEGAETLVTAADLGAIIAPGGTPVTDIVVATFGAAREQLTELPRSQGVIALLAHSFNHYMDPARAFRLVTETASGARVWKLDYNDPLKAGVMLHRQVRNEPAGR